MQVQKFVEIIGAEFYAGVPDSQLKALCNYLINTYGIDSRHHVIAANEGNAAAQDTIWQQERCRLSICRIPAKEILSIRWHHF